MAISEIDDDMLTIVYRFVKGYMEAEGFAPTQREICDACYISRGTAVRVLDMLMARGKLTRQPHMARSIRLVIETEDCL